MLKNKLIDTQFVEEKIVIDVKYVKAGADRMMLIDSGAPKSIVSSRWFEGYLKDAKVSGADVKKKSYVKILRTRSSGRSAPFLLAPAEGWGALRAPNGPSGRSRGLRPPLN